MKKIGYVYDHFRFKTTEVITHIGWILCMILAITSIFLIHDITIAGKFALAAVIVGLYTLGYWMVKEF